jgi:hypothetical protein
LCISHGGRIFDARERNMLYRGADLDIEERLKGDLHKAHAE